MKTDCEKKGFSLTEMVVVVAIIALLTTLGLPAIRSLKKSFESGTGTKNIINAALSSARAIAIKEQRYAGIRFELDFNNNQYMIFIIHDPESTGLSNGFRALEGQKPIKIPEDVRVIDMMCRVSANPETLRDESLLAGGSVGIEYLSADQFEGNYSDNQDNATMRDTSCFSIIFSPSGKLIMHPVRVRNKDGIYRPDNAISTKVSMDDIFNSPENILNFNVGMFLQDDDWDEYLNQNAECGSLGAELSRNRFFIYDKPYFDKLVQYSLRSGEETRTIDYLRNLVPVYINQYTGTIINNSN